MSEEWKDIDEYDGLYQISNLGRVRSFKKIGRCQNGKVKNPRILSPIIREDGYLSVMLSHNGLKKHKYIHRLVLEAFVGPSDLVVCHNDGVKSNNTLGNLRWDTQKNNLSDKKCHGTYVIGEKHWKSKLNDNDIVAIKSLLSKGLYQKEIAQMFKVSSHTIWRINKSRASIGDYNYLKNSWMKGEQTDE